MITSSDFLPDIAPSVPGCPVPRLLMEVRNTAAELLRDSGLWREEIGPLILVSGLRDYLVSVPHEARLARVVGVRMGGQQLRPIPLADARGGVSGTPTGFAVLADMRIRFYPEPDSSDLPDAWVEVHLANSGDDLPDFLADRREAITSGALARLLVQQNTTWYNPQLGAEHLRRFRAMVADARIDGNRGHSNASLRVRPRRFV